MLPTPLLSNIDYDTVYEPSEDSFLLLDCFEQDLTMLQSKFKFPMVCEIGSGSGVVSSFVMTNVFPRGIFIDTDLNPHACSTSLGTIKLNNKSFMADCCQMSLTTAIVPRSIDLLIFNPPYVPAEEVPEVPETVEDSTWLDLALLGGCDGMVVTWKVLDNLHEILSEQGVGYILFCARNKPDEVRMEMERRGWKVEVVIHRKAGWEVLSVLRFERKGIESI